MSKCLERDLESLGRDHLDLAAWVEQAVHKAFRAIQQRDPTLAREVIANDDLIDQAENRIHEECLRLLALHQPVARDLRRVTTVLFVTTDLERMGDLAVSMAGRALALVDQPPLTVPARLAEMAEHVTTMIRQSLDALGRLDTRLARLVCARDDEVDRLNAEIISELTAAMKARPGCVEAGLSLFSVVRQLERIADHATNVAEGVVYLAEGENPRHHPEVLRADRPGAVPLPCSLSPSLPGGAAVAGG